MNDDTVIVTPNWAIKLVETLALNPSIPNFGVTGPSDSNNDKIFTHGFVHRTHLEVSNSKSDSNHPTFTFCSYFELVFFSVAFD